MSGLLSLDIEMGDGGTTVRVAGEIDMATAPSLQECLDSVTGDVVVDLAGVPFIDSTGITVLIRDHKRRHAAGAMLTIRGSSPMALRAFEVTGVDRLLDLDGDSQAS